MKIAYDKGLHELGDGLYAYLQPDGGWGWANAGLITADGTSMLVDTLFDLKLTQAMLDSMAPITEANPIDAAMNTHSNGDHCFGNQLLPADTALYTSETSAAEMAVVTPQMVHGLFHELDLGPEFEPFADNTMRKFDLQSIEMRVPEHTFSGRLDLKVGDRPVHLIELGPAHTSGDTIVHVPDADVVYTGDLLFHEATPIMWAGPVSHWLEACDAIEALGAKTLVPGHGPVADGSGLRDIRRYLEYVRDESRQRFDAGMSVEDAADDIELTGFDDWPDVERIVANVQSLYCEFDPERERPTPAEVFRLMARWSIRNNKGAAVSR